MKLNITPKVKTSMISIATKLPISGADIKKIKNKLTGNKKVKTINIGMVNSSP